MKYFVRGGVVALACLTTVTGCAKTTGRHVDVKAGEYYSEDELAKMSHSDQAAYCSALETERNRVQTELTLTQEDLVATRKQIDGLRNQITPVEKEILRLEADIRTLTGQIAQLERLPHEYTVKEGDCLSIIADRDDIYAAASKWPRIYRANLDKIEDPVWIYPNMVLTIPRELPDRAPRGALRNPRNHCRLLGSLRRPRPVDAPVRGEQGQGLRSHEFRAQYRPDDPALAALGAALLPALSLARSGTSQSGGANRLKTHRRVLSFAGVDPLKLFGPRDGHLAVVDRRYPNAVVVRGDDIILSGSHDQIERLTGFFREIIDIARRGRSLSEQDINYILEKSNGGGGTAAAPAVTPSREYAALENDVVVSTRRGAHIAPRTPGQKRYLDAIRSHDIVFGIGPAGTGKTFLAVARRGGGAAHGRGRAHLSRAPRGRSGREPRFLARRLPGQTRPLRAPRRRRAGRDARPRPHRENDGERHHRDRTARLHARPHAERRLRDPRRSAEHDRDADEDVLDPSRA